MKTLFFLVLFFSITKFPHSSGISTCPISNFNDSAELKEFKSFARAFFDAVEKRDTNFLKRHISFPIHTGSFDICDKSLKGKSTISSTLFFKKLGILFPGNYLNDLQKAEYIISKHPNVETEYDVTIYYERDGVESNINWLFLRKKSQFYFKLFTAEAG